MTHGHLSHQPISSVEARLNAIQAALDERGLKASQAIDELSHVVQEEWLPINGARVVAKAWSDASFRARLLANGIQAVAELGLRMPAHHRHLVALQNTSQVHNVICCTLCSCTAMSIIGAPPDWYKDLDYRARIVRESRTVLKEMGLEIGLDVEVRVWDTTADTRYMVLPERPEHTAAWSEAQLAAIVTRDGMIGVARL